ncbi:hypothetical protein P170DRAFT_160547 [Aspergillus steynii IBT 23096]|uniref:Myb-like DNA-binding domain-containing protein n=1 Tax=Aspergillus steynii IBT 23096 TaxID=1392250 RepID=A0A2I2GDY1_9EURO|nr:uncharacterized protein P170DRAFT_160547 [Aspergillus steynii IBT 23096]PLB51116.1 hypothetical protein P170DRAFT_160547 [Aspergillus steynii IBT 23096]
MAPASKSNESLMFLFICVSNLKDNAIDFNAVAAATNLKITAARMRYYRLKKQLEGELVDGKLDLTKAAADNSESTEAAAAPAMDSASTPAPAKKQRGAKRKKTVVKEENAD